MINLSPNKLNWILRAIPNILWLLKLFIIKKSLKKVGKNFRLGPRCQIFDHRLIEIGDNVFIGDGSMITSVVKIKIGNNVLLGPEVILISGDHNISFVGKPMNRVQTGGENIPIYIENDVWIGSRCIILKGVTIGEGAVIGAGSLVSKSIIPYSVNAGHPSKLLKCRFTYEDLIKHLELVHSYYKPEEIKKLYIERGIQI